MTAKKDLPEERRRARRTIVQESFPLFLVIPQSFGMARLYLGDISKLGLSFSADLDLGITEGQEVKARIYLNPAFYLPVDCKVARINKNNVGLEFLKPEEPAAKCLSLLQDFFDSAEKAGTFV